MFAARVRETTTTTGTGTLTLAGAVAQCQAFDDRILVGDPVYYTLLDANGTDWETGEGTLTTSTTLIRDTVHQSSNSDAPINLSAGTHQVFLDWSHNAANKALYASDYYIDHIISGLTLPSTSGTLAGTIAAGIALVAGNRIKKGTYAKTFTASKDTYVDLDYQGNYVFSEVANGAGAPAIASNALRLGYVVTSGSAITSMVTGAKDSNNHWMGNVYRQPMYYGQLASSPASIPGTNVDTLLTLGNVIVDNVGMHSSTVNPTRLTIPSSGVWDMTFGGVWDSANNGTFSTKSFRNGSGTSMGYKVQIAVGATTSYPADFITVPVPLQAGDYVEFKATNNSGTARNLYPTIGMVKRM